jgi:hypothetical protein
MTWRKLTASEKAHLAECRVRSYRGLGVLIAVALIVRLFMG